VAVIGAFATQPRYQGAGSSLINPTRLDRALDGIIEHAGADNVSYAAGFVLDGAAVPQVETERLVAEAVSLAGQGDVAVVFLGLPAELESEGYDRDDIELPADQLALLDAVAAANPRTVVVLSNGGVVRVGEVADRSAALVEGWLLGQAGGTAIADVLYGTVNPSGRLAETVPHRLQDSPAFLDFPGEHGHVRYGEGVFVGYRWYDARELDVRFPFGHGLSYTTFDYTDLAVTTQDGDLVVSVTVTNTGTRDGREVVQLYTGLASSEVARPPRELKAFQSVELAAGEARRVQLTVRREDLAIWDVRTGRWTVEGGSYAVSVGASSRDVRLVAETEVIGDAVHIPLSLDSSVQEVLGDREAADLVQAALARVLGTGDSAGPSKAASILEDPEMLKLLGSAPIGRIIGFPGTGVTPAEVAAVLDRLNAERGIG
jgi:beta-glucosidase